MKPAISLFKVMLFFFCNLKLFIVLLHLNNTYNDHELLKYKSHY